MDSCDNCETEHPFSGTDKVVLFLENPECNHVLTTCPNCGHVTRIYMQCDSIIRAISEGLGLVLHPRAPLEIKLAKERMEELTAIRKAEQAQLEADYAGE